MRILMVAAENDALRGGKVGGVADVIRDLPKALIAKGAEVDVLTPCYGYFSLLPGAQQLAATTVTFAGESHQVELYHVPASRGDTPGLRNLVLRSALFTQPKPGLIYSDDREEPFATDATRFALFAQAVLSLLHNGSLTKPDVLHLHDWHSAFVALLLSYDPQFEALSAIRTVFSIHNLALQGIRPFSGSASSWYAWFPSVQVPHQEVADPRYPDCINPLRAGIRLSYRVHTVSPSYAQEILQPSDPARGFFGGEGLEGDLQEAQLTGRLVGILNGADYEQPPVQGVSHHALWRACRREIHAWMARNPHIRTVDYLADQRLVAWTATNDQRLLLTSIGRLTAQKMGVLMQPMADGGTCLDALLLRLADQARLLIVGSGDDSLEQQLTVAAATHDNLVFLNGFAADLADTIYASGDLFLMPSAFEPCGISQMLALRAGQPCLVHAVGGLKDTISDGVNGFVFEGDDPAEQANALIEKLAFVLTDYGNRRRKWSAIRSKAAASRFLWADSAQRYLEELYA